MSDAGKKRSAEELARAAEAEDAEADVIQEKLQLVLVERSAYAALMALGRISGVLLGSVFKDGTRADAEKIAGWLEAVGNTAFRAVEMGVDVCAERAEGEPEKGRLN